MMQHSISLYPGRSVTLASYLAAWREVKQSDPGRVYRNGPGSWAPMTAEEILREMRRGIHTRINRQDAAYGRGRKWCEAWQTETQRAARAINTPRLRIHWLPVEWRARFGHRLASHDDF